MQKKGTSQRKQCCTLLLLMIGSLFISFGVMFSYWYFMPNSSHLQLFQSLFQSMDKNISESSAAPPQMETESSLPSALMPKELKLRRGAPFIYQILH